MSIDVQRERGNSGLDSSPTGIGSWSLLPSVGVHGLLLVALAYLAVGHPLVIPPARSIEVEIITPEQYRDAIELPPASSVAPQLAVPKGSDEPPVLVPPASPSDGLAVATEFYSNRLLADPANRAVRETLPTLDRYERIIQLCNIEGLEQLRRARPGGLPDSLSPSALATTSLSGNTLNAPAAAFRVARKWYAVRFVCTVTPEFDGVTDFRFAVGEAIPESDWDAHDLIAADADE